MPNTRPPPHSYEPDLPFCMVERGSLTFALPMETHAGTRSLFFIKIRPNPSKLSSRATADLHQPPIRATAAVCRRPLGRGTDPNGKNLTILSDFYTRKHHRYAVDCDASTMALSRSPVPADRTWDWPLAAPLAITVKAKPFDWPDAWLLPSRPVAANETGPEVQLKLVPYGNAKVLKISTFPYLA